eukprot:TRINITY_DN134_c0_g3_i1.p2 TRINITY_DN134_c0_g3~~TRINITY_DN134_c0_g3_i1.p2  ORF type:complete len:132 (+),score=86.93 TRINITY_DN134_c0_g3_i1:68-463(+)
MPPAKKPVKIDSRVKKAEQGKLVYTIDCSIPVQDGLLEPSALTDLKVYLEEHLKINGKTGQLGEKVKIDATDNAVTITKFKVLFAKRALKFYTRKWLIQQKLRDYLRPVATGKAEYQLRYYNIHLDGDDEE